MRCAILGFASGAALLQSQAELPAAPIIVALLAVGVLLCLLRLLRRVPGAAIAGLLFGFCWAAILASLALAPQLAKVDEGRDLTLVGTIDSLPYHFDQGVRFNFKVERSAGSQEPVPPRVALAWYARPGVANLDAGDVQPGERWQLTVRLQRPHGNANPHGFDYEVWLLEQGLRATGYVRQSAAGNRRLDGFVPSMSNVRCAGQDRPSRSLRCHESLEVPNRCPCLRRRR